MPQPSGTSGDHAHRVSLKPEGIVEDKHPTQLKLQEKGYVQNMLKAKEPQVINNEHAPIDGVKAIQEGSEPIQPAFELD